MEAPPPDNPEPARPHKTARHKPSPAKPVQATDTATQTADKPAVVTTPVQTQAANGTVADVSPIGQLSSSGGGDANSQGHQDVEHLINDTENGLNGIKRTLTNDEQATSTQIKTFLSKAKQALADNDLDGAKTLAGKAKVLLEELTKK